MEYAKNLRPLTDKWGDILLLDSNSLEEVRDLLIVARLVCREITSEKLNHNNGWDKDESMSIKEGMEKLLEICAEKIRSAHDAGFDNFRIVFKGEED